MQTCLMTPLKPFIKLCIVSFLAFSRVVADIILLAFQFFSLAFQPTCLTYDQAKPSQNHLRLILVWQSFHLGL